MSYRNTLPIIPRVPSKTYPRMDDELIRGVSHISEDTSRVSPPHPSPGRPSFLPVVPPGAHTLYCQNCRPVSVCESTRSPTRFMELSKSEVPSGGSTHDNNTGEMSTPFPSVSRRYTYTVHRPDTVSSERLGDVGYVGSRDRRGSSVTRVYTSSFGPTSRTDSCIGAGSRPPLGRLPT